MTKSETRRLRRKRKKGSKGNALGWLTLLAFLNAPVKKKGGRF